MEKTLTSLITAGALAFPSLAFTSSTRQVKKLEPVDIVYLKGYDVEKEAEEDIKSAISALARVKKGVLYVNELEDADLDDSTSEVLRRADVNSDKRVTKDEARVASSEAFDQLYSWLEKNHAVIINGYRVNPYFAYDFKIEADNFWRHRVRYEDKSLRKEDALDYALSTADRNSDRVVSGGEYLDFVRYLSREGTKATLREVKFLDGLILSIQKSNDFLESALDDLKKISTIPLPKGNLLEEGEK